MNESDSQPQVQVKFNDQLDTWRMTVQANIARIDADLQNLKRDITEIKTEVRDLKNTVTQAIGGWKVLIAVASLVSAVATGIIVKLFGG